MSDDERQDRRAENARGVELDLGDVQAVEELRNGTELHVVDDPDDDRFVQVIFRRPKAPGEEMRSFEGAEVSLGQFIRMALNYAVGFGFAKRVARGNRRVVLVDYDAVVSYSQEDDAPKIIHSASRVDVKH